MVRKTSSAGEKAVAKYLARSAEPDVSLAGTFAGEFGDVLVVPAYGEVETFLATLGSVASGDRGDVLVILVLNARSDYPQPVHESNETLRRRLASDLSAAIPLGGEGSLSYPLERGRLVLIERATPGHYLPAGQGIGLARKIGFDLALALRQAGRIVSPWISSTDADTILPRDYFRRTEGVDPDSTGAAIYPFEHRFAEDPRLAEAGRLYEISLRYYVLGLEWAESPYAYHSMGSCLAIPAVSYARVHGFPLRNALEDFYALNKLAKVGAIARLSGTPIELEGRISERVPISTGQALSELVSGRKSLSAFPLYHPLVFAHLAVWLRVLSAIASSSGDFQGALGELPKETPFFRAELLLEVLERLGALRAVRDAIGRSKDEKGLLTRLHTWFDAFKTLKLVHALRSGGLTSIDYLQALSEAPFTGLTASTEENPETLRKALMAQEAALPRATGLPSLRASA
jgi:hypothetical protein